MVKAVVAHRGVLLIAPARWIDFIAFTYTGATRSLTRRHPTGTQKRMLKTFVVAVLAIAMSVGVAEARGTRHVHQAKAKHVHRHKATVTKHVQKNAIPQQKQSRCAPKGSR